MDLLGAGMVGPVVKAAFKFGKIDKALKAKGFTKVNPAVHMDSQGLKSGSYYTKPIRRTTTFAGKTFEVPDYVGRTVTNVDYTNAVQAPLVQMLRVPVTAPFK